MTGRIQGPYKGTAPDTGRTYEHENTVESPADMTGPDPQRGNDTGIRASSIYRYWNAAYRGFAPHGVRLPSPTTGTLEQFEDDPNTFEEDSTAEPSADFEPVESYEQDYWNTISVQVGATQPVLVVGQDNDRTLLRMVNIGPGIVWVGHNESVLNGGFPLIPMATTFYDLELHTTREVWAIQQTAQTTPAQLSVIREYTKEFGQ